MSTHERTAGAQIERLVPRNDDPPAEAGFVLVYVRPFNGVNYLMVRYSDGTVSIVGQIHS